MVSLWKINEISLFTHAISNGLFISFTLFKLSNCGTIPETIIAFPSDLMGIANSVMDLKIWMFSHFEDHLSQYAVWHDLPYHLVRLACQYYMTITAWPCNWIKHLKMVEMSHLFVRKYPFNFLSILSPIAYTVFSFSIELFLLLLFLFMSFSFLLLPMSFF